MPLPPTITDGTVTLTWGPAHQYYGYCTVADVAYEFPNILAQGKNLSNSAIGQEISAAAQEMQDQLILVYQMPYAGADGGILQTLRQINAKLAAANLIDRFFQASDEQVAPSSAERRSWAELVLVDIKTGVIQWSSPFGDAVAQAEKPVYPTSSAVSVMPDPNDPDPNTANPVFSMGRVRYRRTQAF